MLDILTGSSILLSELDAIKVPISQLRKLRSEKWSSVPAVANNQRRLLQPHVRSSLFRRLTVAASRTFLLCASGPAYPVWNALLLFPALKKEASFSPPPYLPAVWL